MFVFTTKYINFSKCYSGAFDPNIILIYVWEDIYLKSFIYSLGALEIFFRVIHFIGDHLGIVKLNEFINSYIPESIKTVLEQYSDGLLEIILVWIFVIFMGILVYYLVKYLIKRK